ncbi:MAG: hypothetical protein KDB53_20820 [Planctomycetes bacterium]|nr:hypothetical protein [Planctomycetota bacterium]
MPSDDDYDYRLAHMERHLELLRDGLDLQTRVQRKLEGALDRLGRRLSELEEALRSQREKEPGAEGPTHPESEPISGPGD